MNSKALLLLVPIACAACRDIAGGYGPEERPGPSAPFCLAIHRSGETASCSGSYSVTMTPGSTVTLVLSAVKTAGENSTGQVAFTPQQTQAGVVYDIGPTVSIPGQLPFSITVSANVLAGVYPGVILVRDDRGNGVNIASNVTVPSAY